MIVWGGYGGRRVGYLLDGASYNPETRRWEKLPPVPFKIEKQFIYTGVWTEGEIIIWVPQGGVISYDPETRKWEKLPPAPITKRDDHTMVWTGKEVIVWGGSERRTYFDDGASYNPETRKWKKLPKTSLKGRAKHTAIWTGKEMIIWGGRCAGLPMYCSDGACFRPFYNK